MKIIKALRHLFNHDWEFDGGKWIIYSASVTTRKCNYCGLKQDIEHMHIFPSDVLGQPGRGISVIARERRPGDKNYDEHYEMNERPAK